MRRHLCPSRSTALGGDYHKVKRNQFETFSSARYKRHITPIKQKRAADSWTSDRNEIRTLSKKSQKHFKKIRKKIQKIPKTFQKNPKKIPKNVKNIPKKSERNSKKSKTFFQKFPKNPNFFSKNFQKILFFSLKMHICFSKNAKHFFLQNLSCLNVQFLKKKMFCIFEKCFSFLEKCFAFLGKKLENFGNFWKNVLDFLHFFFRIFLEFLEKCFGIFGFFFGFFWIFFRIFLECFWDFLQFLGNFFPTLSSESLVGCEGRCECTPLGAVHPLSEHPRLHIGYLNLARLLHLCTKEVEKKK